jgi:hypothetical protein
MTQPARPVRFRRNSALTVAALIVALAGTSISRWAPYLLPVLLIPLAVAVWSWRSGTDADATGVTVRAALRSRTVPWSSVAGLVTQPSGRVSLELTTGATLALPAVTPADVPTLVAAAGQTIRTQAQ